MSTNKILTIDNDLRTIKIPEGVTHLGVECDDEIFGLQFRMPRVYNEIDLSSFDIRINYVNANGDGDIDAVKNKIVEEDSIEFTWFVSRFAAATMGDVEFNVCLKKLDGTTVIQEFNTTPAKLPVLRGLETIEKIKQKYPDVLEEWHQEVLGGFTGEIDKTLSVSGQAADAAVTGDRLTDLAIAANNKANKSELIVERKRIDNMIATKETIADDAELLDIRVAADGSVHTNAGTAVRRQIQDLKADFAEYDQLYKSNRPFAIETVIDGVYIDENGVIASISDMDYKCSDYIDCGNIRSWTVRSTGIGTAAYHCALYDEYKNLISVHIQGTGSTDDKTVAYAISTGLAKYIVFCWHNTDGISVSYSDVIDFASQINMLTERVNNVGQLASTETKEAVDITFINGYYLNSAGAPQAVSSNYYYISEFIELDSTKLDVQISNVGESAYNYALYDKNKICLGVYQQGTGSTITMDRSFVIDIPLEAAYIRFCWCESAIAVSKTVMTSASQVSEALNSLWGKTLIGLGDSLMTSAYTDPGKEWLSLIGNRNNMTVRNYALSGNPISVQDDCMAARYSEMEDADDAYIIVMGGANDKNIGAPIGENYDTTIETFKGALNVLINGLISKYPTSKIIFCTNYKRYGDAAEKEYVDAMLEVCALHSIPCHNNYTSSGCHFDNQSWMQVYGANPSDMTNKHLNGVGDERVSTMYEALLKSL